MGEDTAGRMADGVLSENNAEHVDSREREAREGGAESDSDSDSYSEADEREDGLDIDGPASAGNISTNKKTR